MGTLKKEGKIKVMLADDHNIFRHMIAKYLNEECKSTIVIGDAPNGEVLLKIIEKNIPDIVLLDLEMPVLDGHKTLMQIKERFPTVKTIILSTHYNEFYIAQLMINGACGYLSKSCFEEDVVNTIEKVYEDGFYFNKGISKEIITSLLEDNRLEYLVTDRILKDREIEILKLICKGKLYKEVAEELNLSHDTIKFHIKNIYKKTNIHSTALLVKYAIKVGITTVD